MFIHARAARLFRNRRTGETFLVQKEFIGEVPEWVTKTQLFRSACAAGTITALVSSRDNALLAGASPEQAAIVRKAASDREMAEAAYQQALAQAGIPAQVSTAQETDPAPPTGTTTPVQMPSGTTTPDGGTNGEQPKTPAKPTKPKKPAKPKPNAPAADSADD